jgi:hypothetical protein
MSFVVRSQGVASSSHDSWCSEFDDESEAGKDAVSGSIFYSLAGKSFASFSEPTTRPAATAAAAPTSAAATAAAGGGASVDHFSGLLSGPLDVTAAYLLSSYRRCFACNLTAAILAQFEQAKAAAAAAAASRGAFEPAGSMQPGAAAAAAVPAKFAVVLGAFEQTQKGTATSSTVQTMTDSKPNKAAAVRVDYSSCMQRIVAACSQELQQIKLLLLKQHQQQQQQQQSLGPSGSKTAAAAAAEGGDNALPVFAQLLSAAAWWGSLEALQQLVRHPVDPTCFVFKLFLCWHCACI